MITIVRPEGSVLPGWLERRREMLKEMIRDKNLPPVLTMNDGRSCDSRELWDLRRREIVDLFSREVYGYMPPAPERVSFRETESREELMGGAASYRRIEASFDTPGGPYAFEFDFYLPYSDKKVPAFVYIQFPEHPVHSTFPVEEITHNGFAVAMMRNCNVMEDRNDFTQGLAGMYLRNRSGVGNQNSCANTDNRGGMEWGAIGAWAFAASRMMDYFYTLDTIDLDQVAVVGHSRLGKTALWCAANDERFGLAVINASGNTGASLSTWKDEKAEKIAQIVEKFPYWFCRNYYKYAGKEAELPFDQHMLTSSLAPRHFYVCSGSQDSWADPLSEFFCCVASDDVYGMLGMKGFICPDRLPEPGCIYDEGDIGYSMHDGKHFMGRFEWDNVMNYMKYKMGNPYEKSFIRIS